MGLVSLVIACLLVALGAKQLESSLSSLKNLHSARKDDEDETKYEKAILDGNVSLQGNWKWVWIIVIILSAVWVLSALGLTIRSFDTEAAKRSRFMDIFGRYKNVSKPSPEGSPLE